MSLSSSTFRSLFASVGLLVALSASASADPAYVGTWAADLAQCSIGQDKEEAPLVLKPKGYDQYETHCTFKSVDAKADQWKVAADCSVQGDAQAFNMTLTVSGDTLTIADDNGTQDLLRCK